MEHTIAKLLRDFEDGLTNRRQLIQSLAVAATGAATATVYAQKPADQSSGTRESPFKTVELDHISYRVKDYRVTRDFYADLMGMDVKNDNGETQCELHFGTSILLARNFLQPANLSPKQGAPGHSENPPGPTSLVDHIAYRIYNWDTEQVREELLRRKLLAESTKPDTGGGPGYSSFHVSDPDGFNLQISGLAGPHDSVTKKK